MRHGTQRGPRECPPDEKSGNAGNHSAHEHHAAKACDGAVDRSERHHRGEVLCANRQHIRTPPLTVRVVQHRERPCTRQCRVQRPREHRNRRIRCDTSDDQYSPRIKSRQRGTIERGVLHDQAAGVVHPSADAEQEGCSERALDLEGRSRDAQLCRDVPRVDQERVVERIVPRPAVQRIAVKAHQGDDHPGQPPV